MENKINPYSLFLNPKSLFLGSVIFLFSCSSTPSHTDFTWLEGTWKGRVSDIVYVEVWKRNNPESVNGSTFIIQAGDTVHRDFPKIEIIADLPCYIITIPKTKETVVYKMIKGNDHEAIFENQSPEMPKLIAYQIEGDSLHVRFEGIEDGHKAREEVYYHKK